MKRTVEGTRNGWHRYGEADKLSTKPGFCIFFWFYLISYLFGVFLSLLYIWLYVEFEENGGLWSELADQTPIGYSGLSSRFAKEHVPPSILWSLFVPLVLSFGQTLVRRKLWLFLFIGFAHVWFLSCAYIYLGFTRFWCILFLLYMLLYVEFEENGGLGSKLAGGQTPKGYPDLSSRFAKEYVPSLIIYWIYAYLVFILFFFSH